MFPPRIGIWLIGARGGVAATATLGLTALQKNLARTTGLVSGLPKFEGLDFADWSRFVVGGHEIRESSLVDSVERLRSDSRVLDAATIDACRDELAAVDARIRPGTLANCGQTIGNLAGDAVRTYVNELPRDTLKRLQQDLRDFQRQNAV